MIMYMNRVESEPMPQVHAPNPLETTKCEAPMSIAEIPEQMEITKDEFKVVIRSLQYLEGRNKPTYHGKIAPRAFGSRNNANEGDNYSRLLGMLDTLVEHDVLETKHRKYSFAGGHNLVNTDYSEIFAISQNT